MSLPNFRSLQHVVAYGTYRGCVMAARVIPLPVLFLTGKVFGFVGWMLLRRRRRLAEENLAAALGLDEKEAALWARRHFTTFGANVLSMLKIPSMSDGQVWRHVAFHISPEISREPDGKGWVAVLSHMSNWELLARLSRLFPQYRFGALYQKLANPRVNAHFNESRSKMGVRLFDRSEGFWECAAFLETGGVVGVLSDQYAGAAGTWMPFFGRLTSTSTMAAALAQRAGVKIVPITVTTIGIARWQVSVESALPAGGPPEVVTAAINGAFERQISQSPADWLWTHNRWKTPAFGFFLTASGRRVFFPPAFERARLKPYRILVRSVDDPAEARLAVPAVQAMKRGRPDVHLTVVTPETLGDFWRAVAGVDAVISFRPEESPSLRAKKISAAGPFAVGILLPPDRKAAWEMALAGVPRRLGAPGRAFLSYWGNPPGSSDPPPSGEERYRRIASAAGAAL